MLQWWHELREFLSFDLSLQLISYGIPVWLILGNYFCSFASLARYKLFSPSLINSTCQNNQLLLLPIVLPVLIPTCTETGRAGLQNKHHPWVRMPEWRSTIRLWGVFVNNTTVRFILVSTSKRSDMSSVVIVIVTSLYCTKKKDYTVD